MPIRTSALAWLAKNQGDGTSILLLHEGQTIGLPAYLSIVFTGSQQTGHWNVISGLPILLPSISGLVLPVTLASSSWVAVVEILSTDESGNGLMIWP